MPAQTIDAGAPAVEETIDGRFYAWRGTASLEHEDDVIRVRGPSRACTLTHLALEANSGAESFLPEVGYTEGFDPGLISGRAVADVALAPYRTQVPLVLDAYDDDAIYIRPSPQDTTPTELAPFDVEFVIVIREGHHA